MDTCKYPQDTVMLDSIPYHIKESNMKLFAALFAFLLSAAAFADPVRVPGIWGFAVGSTQGTYFRAILEQANKDQKKYEFSFDHRPGAGGAIAARTALDHRGAVIMAHSGAFFARPYLYPDTPYKHEQFRPVLVMASAPAVLMTKGKSLDQLLKQPRITIGTAGAGSSTHLMAETFKKYIKNSEVTMVHFKDTNEAYINVMGGHVDATFEFFGDAKGKATPEVSFLGVTGSQRVDGVEPLRNRNMPDMEHVSGLFAVYVPVTTPADIFTELRTILLQAERAEAVQALYRRDFSYRDPAWQNQSAIQSWFDSTVRRFQSLTAGIKVQ